MKQRLLAEATSGISGGAEFAKAVQELEQLKLQLEIQRSDWQSSNRILTHDLHCAIDSVCSLFVTEIRRAKLMTECDRKSSCKVLLTNTRKSISC